jgi:hypothetical protein
LGVKRHAYLHCVSPLMTQSGHRQLELRNTMQAISD